MNTLTTFLKDASPHWLDYVVYAAIAIVSIIGVIKCLVPLWSTTRSLRSAVKKLQDEAGSVPDRPVWQEPRFMGKRLKGCWLRFLQNAEQLDRRGLPCNVEDYVNDDTVTHGPGNAQLAELIPSLLTSLGILGTFMGMTSGLSGLDVTTTENMMGGIQNLLNGMQFAFGTSVAGVSCSLVFNMLNRISQGSSYRAIDDFTEAFTSLAMQRPLDNDVQMICQNQDRNHLLNTVQESMQVKVPAAMENAVRSAMQPVTRSMEHFMMGATAAQIEGLQRIVGQFVSEMNRSLDGQFLALGRTMSELNQNQHVSVTRLREALDATGDMIHEVEKMQQVSGDVLDQFEQYIRELAHARQRDETFEARSSDMMGRIQSMAQDQAQLLKAMSGAQEALNQNIRQFQAISEQHLQHLEAFSSSGAAEVSQAGSVLREASLELSGSYQQFVEHVVEGVSTSLGLFDRTMREVLQNYASGLEQMQGGGNVQSRDISSIQQILARMEKSLCGKEA